MSGARSSLFWLTAALAAAGCGDNLSHCPEDNDLPEAWTLSAPGIEVEVSRSPYAITVRDSSGVAVLESLPGTGDGYSAVGWTSGVFAYDRFFSPGYTTFFENLNPWRDEFRVVAATREDSQLTVTLVASGGPDETCIEVVHTLRDSTLRVEASADRQTPRAWSAGFATPDDEGFLGFGERFNRTDQRGLDVFSWLEEGGIGKGVGEPESADNPFPSGQLMTYYPVPFFLSTKGYGFWLDTNYWSEFNLASSREDAWRAWHVGPTLAYEVYVSAPDDTRPWPFHIIDSFTEATGRPMLPPAWTYGPRRRIGRGSMADGMPEIEAMRDQDLAITAVDDAMHFYPSGSHFGNEAVISEWIDSAEELGYRVNGYFNSFVNQDPESPIADHAAEGVEGGFFLTQADGEFPNLWIITGGDTPLLYLVDFTNPDASAWFEKSFEWATSLGYSGWMYDFGEYVPWDTLGFDGTTGEELHNLYPVLYGRAVHQGMEASDQAGDWLAFVRSGYTGSSQFAPMVWGGDPAGSFEDADGLPSMIPAALNLGISGAPNWGGDIGGFHCSADGALAADGELMTRWIQQGALSPNMQDQNACVGSSSSQKASIWSSDDAKQAWRTYARLHTRLFPYLFTLGHEANRTGAPIMRHMFLEHPDRDDLRAVDDAYYFGPALLVAPVIERGATTKGLELPDGWYLDWSAQLLLQGGSRVTVDAPLDKLPLLLRADNLVVMLDPSIDTLAEEDSTEIVGPGDVDDVYDVVALVSPTGAASQTLYDDDEFSLTRTGDVAAPLDMDQATTPAELSTCGECYWIDDLDDGLVRVRISSSSEQVEAGGLTLRSSSERKIRWDLYLVP